VNEYRASFSQDDVWYEYKQAGFLVLEEDLGEVGPDQMVAPFEAELFSMYNTMVSEVARNLISPNNVESSFGVHMVYAHNYNVNLMHILPIMH
jgi:parvulin-like peptidyl-prolyl isomerase